MNTLDVLRKHYISVNAPFKITPNRAEPDALLLGNGDLGASWATEAGSAVCWLGKNDFWQSKPTHMGGGIKNVAVLTIHADGLRDDSFSSVIDLANAEACIRLKTEKASLKIDTCVLRGRNILLATLTCVSNTVRIKIDLSPLDDPESRREKTAFENCVTVHKCYNSSDIEWASYAYASMRVLNWKTTAGTLNEGESIIIAVSVCTSHDTQAYRQSADNELNTLNGDKLNAYQTAHREWWNNFWLESSVQLPDEPELERRWYTSHYLMACCCEKGKYAPGLYGNFITTDHSFWGSDYHLNYNYQAPWWGVFSSNKVTLSEPYDKPLIDYIPKARQNAETLLSCRGIYSIVGIGPMNYETEAMVNNDGTPNRERPFWGQKSNAAYAAVNMLMRFYSTWDEDYAREFAYPYLCEVTAFWEDYLKWEDERYVIYNDCIHENPAAGIKEADRPVTMNDYSDDFNPLVSLALVRCVFRGTIEIASLLGLDEDKKEKRQHIIDHISRFPTQERNGKTVFRYTERGMDWWKDNTLGIQHVYPCGEIGLGSEPQLLEIARNTLAELSRWDDNNGFATFYTAAARLGHDPDEILHHMNEQVQKHGLDNGFLYYGGGGIENLSAIPGCINEMLLQSHEGIIRLFPNWNPQRNASFSKLRAYGAFLVSADMKDGSVQNASLYSEKGRRIKVLSPWGNRMIVRSVGDEIECSLNKSGNEFIYSFDTQPNATYNLCRE